MLSSQSQDPEVSRQKTSVSIVLVDGIQYASEMNH